jgi:5-methyltetrahydrofolate--homocysteine methyltransferase
MTTTMLELKEVLRALEENGLRNTLKIMIGGVPTTQQFADEIGADAWGRDALDAVAAAKQLIEKVRKNGK